MAKATVKKTEETETTSNGFDFGAVQVKEAKELPKATRQREPNPLDPTVKLSVDAGYKPMEFGPIPADMVSKAKNLMHRAAREADHGITIREMPQEDGTVILVFCAKEGKRERKYVMADVRKWVEENYSESEQESAGYAPGKKVPTGVIAAYRKAMGIDSE